MGDFQSTESFRFRYFQGECAVGIGHRSDIVADNRDVHVSSFFLLSLFLTVPVMTSSFTAASCAING